MEQSKLDKAKQVIRDFNKSQGKVMIKSASEVEKRNKLSFGVEALDRLTNGGIEYGVTTVIWGEAGTGKTTLALKLIAQAQKEGKICLYADIERSFNKDWAIKQGIDIDKLIYGKFFTAEQPLDAIVALAKEQCVDLILIDSIQGLSPKAEQIKGKSTVKSLEDDTIALLARKLSLFFRVAIPYINEAKTALVMIGQARTNLGSFVALDTLSSGHALKHNSRLTLRVRRGQGADAPTEEIVDDDGKKHETKIGYDMVVKVEKAQLEGVKELSEIHLPFYFGVGFKKDNKENVEDLIEETRTQSPIEDAILEQPKKKRGRPSKKDK